MKDPIIVYLSIGSNLEDRYFYLQKAKEELEKKVGTLVNQSAVYATKGWGVSEQNDYLNQALAAKTQLSPDELLKETQAIELELGRVRNENWSERTIDIDILYYGEQVIVRPDLVIPHIRLHQRNFVLVPLCEIAPSFQHPIFSKNTTELMAICPDKSAVKKY